MKSIRTKGLLVVAALAAGVAGCGSSGGGGPSGSATVNGTIAGMAFSPRDAVSFVYQSTANIVIASDPDLCANAEHNVAQKNETFLVLGAPTETGTFPVTNFSNPNAAAIYYSTDSMCQAQTMQQHQAQSGNVTIDQISSSGISGSFNLAMDTGEHITGTFNAPACAALSPASWTTDGGSVTCR